MKSYNEARKALGLDAIDIDALESVDIIASGYEWECPHCENLNKLIEYPSSQAVTCEQCGEVFRADDPEHAMD